ncbi:GntP family permease [Arthrobacter castelli]|uniref:GntP family permease n=1 Tax=Arthrobacter castelli TaxID=271431 RepID=UPI000406355B|nr:SLC13 family permease [Arthrobacter castelli]
MGWDLSDFGVIASAVLTILGIVFLILRLKVDPVIALVVGSLALVLVNGLGPEAAIEAVITGFGDLMLEIGLVIGFGVLTGTLLSYMGAIQKLGALLLRKFGPRAMPYAFGVTIGTVLASLFIDVCLVMTAPLAKATSSKIGKDGLARMAAAVMIGLEVALTMTIPGVVALALSGILDVPVGIMLIFGVPTAVLTIVSSIFIMNVLFRMGFWKPELDESAAVAKVQAAEQRADQLDPVERSVEIEASSEAGAGDRGEFAGSAHMTATATEAPEGGGTAITLDEARQPGLIVAFAPLIVALLLISGGAIADVAGVESPVLTLFSNPTVALLVALIGAWIVCRFHAGHVATGQALSRGFQESGQILLITGVGGCLAAAVETIGIGDILTQYFEPGSFAPLILVWIIAAILHIAIGSVTTAAITAAGILAPFADSLDANPVLIALAAASGGMFIIHVTSNTFWLMKTLFGLSTRGAFKTDTVAVSIASVMGLVWVLVLSLFI